MSILMILLGILAIGIIALIHELGHFFFAKKAGIKVEELSLGAGPKIFSFTKNETLYSIRPIPILAYVKLEEEGENGLKSASFLSKFLMYIGGVLFNFMTAIIIFTIIGVFSGYYTDKVIVSETIEGTPASTVLEKDDQIIEFNGKKITGIEDFVDKLYENEDREATLVVERDGEEKELSITPEYSSEEDRYMIGFSFGKEKMNIFSSFINSFKTSFSYVGETFKLLGRMLIGAENPKDNLVGIVGIVSLTSTFASNVADFFTFMAIISLGMAIINILPIPALDGGKILILVIEKIRGKSISEKVEGYLTLISFSLLILLIIYIT